MLTIGCREFPAGLNLGFSVHRKPWKRKIGLVGAGGSSRHLHCGKQRNVTGGWYQAKRFWEGRQSVSQGFICDKFKNSTQIGRMHMVRPC